MATTLPAALTKVHWDDNADDVLQALSEMATNIDLTNSAFGALGGAALLDVGDGLTTGAEASGTPDKLKLSVSGSFRFSSGGLLQLSDFVRVEADDDEASHNSPPDLNLSRLKTAIAVGDLLGSFKYRGSNSSGKNADIIYLSLVAKIVSAAAGSEAVSYAIKTMFAGAIDDRMLFGGGQWSKASGSEVDGGDKGPGTINAHDYWRRNALLPLQIPFTSAEVTPVVDSVNAIGTHSLGGLPHNIHAVLRCKTTDLGYSVDDEIVPVVSHVSADDGYTILSDATRIDIVVGQAIRIQEKSTFNIVAITPASWAWVVYAQR